ncbi:50S ribosomal protein L32 [PVC group bacterium]|nr:50S ribosomal protein L32 [PVC group bacterium]
MAVPKQRLSKAKTRSRKHCGKALKVPILSKCTQCGKLLIPHRVCPSCGFYKGTKVLETKEA